MTNARTTESDRQISIRGSIPHFFTPFVLLSLSNIFFLTPHFSSGSMLPVLSVPSPNARSSINRPESSYQTTDTDLTRFFVGRRDRNDWTTLNKPLPDGIFHRRARASDEFLHSFLADARSGRK